jgi:DNA-binding transcriptional regulator YiaG
LANGVVAPGRELALKPFLGYPALGCNKRLVTRSVFTPSYDRFRALLVEARKSRKLTQADVATRLGRPQSFVSKYERGERRLDVVEFLEVARAIGVDPKRLIDKLRQDGPN